MKQFLILTLVLTGVILSKNIQAQQIHFGVSAGLVVANAHATSNPDIID